MRIRRALMTACVAVLCLAARVAHSQIPVIDVASLGQLIAELQTLEQQVATARSQLAEAQTQLQSMTGARGMQRLLAGTPRNYLPDSWAAVQNASQGSAGGWPALAQDIRGAVAAEQILTPAQLAALSPLAAAQLGEERTTAALLQSVSHEALADSSGRFAALQQLVNAIGAARDQKAILELEARIAAEDGMLENEHTKLETLYQAAQAQRWTDVQRGRERAIAGYGQFVTRFEPQP